MNDNRPINVGDVWKDCTGGSCRHVRILAVHNGRVAAIGVGWMPVELFLERFRFAYARQDTERILAL